MIVKTISSRKDLHATPYEFAKDLHLIGIEDELMAFLFFAFYTKNHDEIPYQEEKEERLVCHGSRKLSH